MKKTMAMVGAVLSGACAFGAIDVAFSNVVGVVRVMSTNHYTLVSVPFNSVRADPTVADITLSNLVQRVNLSTSDRVQIYSDEGDVMFSWTLNPKGVWTPVGGYYSDYYGNQVKYTPAKANEQLLSKGLALRVYRKKPTESDGSAKPFYLIGQYDSVSGERVLLQGTKLRPRRSLVSFPGISTFDLNSIQTGVHVGSTDADSDEISLITDGAPIVYTPKMVDSTVEWGHYVDTTVVTTNKYKKEVITTKRVRQTDGTLLPIGAGFWYTSRGGAPTITWGPAKE